MKSNRGFTLIELLVVMVLLGLTTSLLAPDMYKTFTKVKINGEISNVQSSVKLLVEESFFKSNHIKLLFKGRDILIQEVADSPNISSDYIDFFSAEYVQFEETSIQINKGKWEGSKVIKLTKGSVDQKDEIILLE